MRYAVLEPITVKKQGQEIELQTGQVITLQKDKAIKLIEAGKITPIEKVAYKIYSELLGCCLWVAADEKDMKTLRAEGIAETVFTHHEIRELKKLPKEAIKEIHKVKQVFLDAKVIQVKLTEQGELSDATTKDR